MTFGRAGLDDMKAIKNTFGTTVNDVVLAACTMMLRQWLTAHDALPDRPLVATCPVSVHEEQKDTPGTNKVSSMFVSLPVQLEDPVEQLMAIHEGTKGAKEVNKAMGADMITGLAEFAPPALVDPGDQPLFAVQPGRPPPAHPQPHRLQHPGTPIFPSTAPAPKSWRPTRWARSWKGAASTSPCCPAMGNVDFGAIACRELVPDLSDMATGFADAVDTLKKAAAEK